jgi:hypothetical protein
MTLCHWCNDNRHIFKRQKNMVFLFLLFGCIVQLNLFKFKDSLELILIALVFYIIVWDIIPLTVKVETLEKKNKKDTN